MKLSHACDVLVASAEVVAWNEVVALFLDELGPKTRNVLIG